MLKITQSVVVLEIKERSEKSGFITIIAIWKFLINIAIE